MSRRMETGTVTSAASAKTRRVEIPRVVRHPKYGRILHRRTVCHVHDEAEESGLGDTVEIVECRPRSRLKRWELVRVVAKSTAVDVASLRSGARATRLRETAARAEAAAATGAEEPATRPAGGKQQG